MTRKSLVVLPLAIFVAASAGAAPAKKNEKKARKIASHTRGFADEKKLRCAGTEPFWGAHFTRKGEGVYEATFSSPLDEDQKEKKLGKFASEPFHGMAANYGGYLRGSDGNWAIIVSDAKCSDGMSDYEYPYEIFFHYGSGVFYGCCGEPLNPEAGS